MPYPPFDYDLEFDDAMFKGREKAVPGQAVVNLGMVYSMLEPYKGNLSLAID